MDEVEWSCSICGPHPDSSSMWCAAGCGRDYNIMYETVHPYTVESYLIGAENPPCFICRKGGEFHG